MGKKRYDISIDEKLWEKARSSGMNISNFVETCLDSFLNVNPVFLKEYVRLQKTSEKTIRKSSVDAVKYFMGVSTKKKVR